MTARHRPHTGVRHDAIVPYTPLLLDLALFDDHGI
jgi:hypothetical protein